MSKAYEAPSIKIEMSMGHEKGHLGEAAKKMVRGFLEIFESDDPSLSVKGIKVKSQPIDGERAEDINLIDQILSTKRLINTESNNPDFIFDLCSQQIIQIIRDYDK